MFKKITFVAAGAALLSACAGSEDFTPPPTATALDIHNMACASCHGPVQHNGETYFWEITAENANTAYIKDKVSNGSMMMPSFPNIKGEKLDTLVAFVLEKNKAE